MSAPLPDETAQQPPSPAPENDGETPNPPSPGRVSPKRAPKKAAKRGRPTKFDDKKRDELCLMIRVGCSVRAAAGHLGLQEQVIRRARRKSSEFDEQVRKAERQRNLLALQNIAAASRKSWRASAWVLRSADPDNYDLRRHANAQGQRRLKEIVTKLVNELVPSCIRKAQFAHDDAILDNHPFEMTPSSAPPFAVPPHNDSMSDIDSKSAIDRIGKRLDEVEAKYGPNAPPEKILNELFPDIDDRQTFEEQITSLKNRLMKKHGHKLNPKPATN